MENENENKTKAKKKLINENNEHLFTKKNAQEMQARGAKKHKENKERERVEIKKINEKVKKMQKNKNFRELLLCFLNEAIPDDDATTINFLEKQKTGAKTYGEALAKTTVKRAITTNDATASKIIYDAVTRKEEERETGGGVKIVIKNTFSDTSKGASVEALDGGKETEEETEAGKEEGDTLKPLL